MQETHKYAGLFSSRARYAEDALEKDVRKGVKQYVILGAGMDTFAFRQPKMMEHLEIFEVTIPQHKNLSFVDLLSWNGSILQNYILFL